jgi:uncharacterized membrane protein
MLMSSFRFDHELAWPWSLKPLGPWVLVAVAVLLVVLTVWTYLGVRGATTRRVLLILGLRLLALVLACLMVARPSLAVRETTFLPAQLLIALDRSKSMTINDEFDGKSRWGAMQDHFKEKAVVAGLERLEKQNVTIVQHAFADDVRPYDNNTEPDGPRTDFGTMLQTLYNQHRTDKNLLGLLIISDGADNGTRFPSLAEAARWKTLPCKIYTVGVGKPTTMDQQKDIAITGITVEPSPVPAKGKMTVRATVDAAGFENSPCGFRLLLNDKEVDTRKQTLRNKTGNDVVFVTDAPATAGEVKVTLEAEEKPGEATHANNKIHTFATISQEGISILLVAKPDIETMFLHRALESDTRFRVYSGWRHTLQRGGDLFQFDQQHYDVIIIGDLTKSMFTAGDPSVLERVRELVENKGTGLLMMGGQDSFGNTWAATPIADLLPVELGSGQFPDEVRMEPTDKGLERIVMQLEAKSEASKQLWKQLPPLNGMTKLGRPKNAPVSASVFAERAGSREPILVYWQFKQGGRVVAFAGDTTWQWTSIDQPKMKTGSQAHSRFWRQLMLFLAKQDQVDGNAWIKPETRRIAAGGKLDFTVGLRGKHGTDIKDAQFEVVAHNPKNVAIPVETSRDNDAERGSFWKTDQPGEYKIEVMAHGKDIDGTALSGRATARFIVYQDEVEMARKSADHDFLEKLARTGGGKFFPSLDKFFNEINQQTQAQSTVKTERWPDWDKESSFGRGRLDISWFLLFFFTAFAACLCSEWFLRRRWGLV